MEKAKIEKLKCDFFGDFQTLWVGWGHGHFPVPHTEERCSELQKKRKSYFDSIDNNETFDGTLHSGWKL